MTEDQLQISCADYLRWKHSNLLWWHSPNGGKRNVMEALKLKKMGVKAGVPDIFIALPQQSTQGIVIPVINARGEREELYLKDRDLYSGFFCELKAGKNKPTPNQKEVMQQLKDQGYYVCVCYTLDEFIKEVESYLGNI